MKILFVSYPMLPVSDASCGGAEQMLWTLEREMAQRGHDTAVAACEGSRVSGELIATGVAPTAADAFEQRAKEHSTAVIAAADAGEFDLVHDKSGFFWRHSGELKVPVLATLHLPRTFYEESLFRETPENLFFNCVSESQAGSFCDLKQMIGVVRNGIAVDRFRLEPGKEDYVLWLGRICPEKAPHLAIDAAERAGVRLVMAGQVYPFSWHHSYFEKEIRPRLERLGDRVTWVEAPSFEEKAQLLSRARALLLPTLAPETSSLVAMEAMASGTPVIAFPSGALPEIVEDGVTGILVFDVAEMAWAISDANRISPETARRAAEEKFSSKAMTDGYESLYRAIASEADKVKKLVA
jgi:glycosyltransferase involved in cell wall biosynthesis